LLQIDIPRIVYQQGISTSHHYLIVMMLSGLVVLFLTWYLMKVFVLGRVLSIKNQVSQVDNGRHDYHPVVLSGDDELNQMVGSINHMMTMIMNTQTDLRHMANFDSLTQLPNRNHFSELLSQVIKKAHHNSENVAVMFIDMDKLKFVNDKYGHAMGDKLIQYVVNRIKHVIKSTDIMARQSGDEFLLFVDHVYDLRSVTATARRILDTTAIPFTIDGIEILTTFSVGVSVYPDNGITVEELIKNADTAMYRVKTTGGNNFDFYQPELDRVN
jgi:diguanylate cyclase (GGDEF)-like protein